MNEAEATYLAYRNLLGKAGSFYQDILERMRTPLIGDTVIELSTFMRKRFSGVYHGRQFPFIRGGLEAGLSVPFERWDWMIGEDSWDNCEFVVCLPFKTHIDGVDPSFRDRARVEKSTIIQGATQWAKTPAAQESYNRWLSTLTD